MLYLTYGLIGGLGTGIVYVGVVGLDGALVPGSTRLRGRHGRGRLRHGRDRHDLSDLHVAADARRGIHAVAVSASCSRVVGLLASQGLRRRRRWQCGPTARRSAEGRDAATSRPARCCRTPLFWLMFAMMTMMSTSGLMVTSQMASFARDFGVSRRARLRHGRVAAGADDRPLHERSDASASSAGYRIAAAARTRCASRSRSKAWRWRCGC